MHTYASHGHRLKPWAAAFVVTLAFATQTYAAPGTPGPNPNPGGGGGGGDGGGGGMDPPDFGDLFVLYRDGDGIPILTADLCQQPLAAPGVELPGSGTYPGCSPAAGESCVIPVDPATCSVLIGYETYTQEVDFGRTNAARSPVSVLASQLEEAVTNLSNADCVSLDPSGRLVTSTVTDGVVTSAAIDSPLENMAIYKQLMLTGYLGSETAPLGLPASPLEIAASAMGAGSSKSGKVTVDTVVYLNQFLGLTDPTVETFIDKKCIQVREEVMGEIALVEKCFLDYGAAGYTYSRAATIGSLPRPAYIPADAPQDGWSEYLATDEASVTDPLDRDALRFMIGEGPTLAVVPELVADPVLTASSIAGFAQAADDARAVIEYLHSWPLPSVYTTPLSCAASGDIHYDVSISEESGLQVPVRMVAGTEGREFSLTVANAGPDEAKGSVLLTALNADGTSVANFPRSFDFTLPAGSSTAWTESFSTDAATTITWTATVSAPFDVNPGNNTVTATTQVIGRGSGRSGIR